MIKAVFFDIDGTLVSFKTHRIPETTIACLRALQAKGIKLFISTGRPICFINNLDDYPFDGYIYMNGALVVADGEVLLDVPIDRETSVTVAGIGMRENIPTYIFTRESFGVNCMNEASLYMREQINNPIGEFVDVEQIARTQDAYEFTVFMTKEQEEEYLHSKISSVEYPRWHPTFMDIIPSGISKAKGAAAVLEHYGFAVEECMAFGDGGNDIPIIEFAGIGVAMGNADESVKSVADYVTTDIEEDGIVEAFRHFGMY